MNQKMIKTGKVVGIAFNAILTFSLCVGLITAVRDHLKPATTPLLLVFSLALTGLSTGINIANSEETVK